MTAYAIDVALGVGIAASPFLLAGLIMFGAKLMGLK